MFNLRKKSEIKIPRNSANTLRKENLRIIGTQKENENKANIFSKMSYKKSLLI